MKKLFSFLAATLLVSVVMIGNAQAGSITRFTDLTGAVINNGNPVMIGQEFYIEGSGFGASAVNNHVGVDFASMTGFLELIIKEGWTDNRIKVQIPYFTCSNCYRPNLINIGSVPATSIADAMKDFLEGNEKVGRLKIVKVGYDGSLLFTGPMDLSMNFVEIRPESRFESMPPPVTGTMRGEEKPTFTARKAPMEGSLRRDRPASAGPGATGTVTVLKPEIINTAPHEVNQGGMLWIHGMGFGSEKGTVIYRKGWLRSIHGRNAFAETEWYSSGCQIGAEIPEDMEPGTYYISVKRADGRESNVMETKIVALHREVEGVAPPGIE